jgi:hypothetical protein
MKDLRRIVIAVVIGSFSLAALMGILALLVGLTAGEIGETQGKILATTVIVGLGSLGVLCCLAVAGHRLFPVGIAGGAASLVCAATAMWFVWAPWEWGEPWRLLGTTLVLALTLCQASLLIAMADRDRLRGGLVLTLALAGVAAVMLIIPILAEEFPESLGYWTFFGIVMILDVLGTIVLIALGAVMRRTPAAADASAEGRPSSQAVHGISPAVGERVAAMAAARGTTPDALVAEALDRLAEPVDR